MEPLFRTSCIYQSMVWHELQNFRAFCICPALQGVCVGCMEMVTYMREGEGGRLKKCLHYPINRVRCWKVGDKVLAVTSHHEPPPSCTYPHTFTLSHPHTHHTLTSSQEGSHWVSFHFQQSCDELVWVTVVGKAAIFLALCLHSVTTATQQ